MSPLRAHRAVRRAREPDHAQVGLLPCVCAALAAVQLAPPFTDRLVADRHEVVLGVDVLLHEYDRRVLWVGGMFEVDIHAQRLRKIVLFSPILPKLYQSGTAHVMT